MMNIKREDFIINCNSSEIFKQLINLPEIYKIEIIPICIYDKPESKKDRLACVILGKKESDKYDFLNRKIIQESSDIFGSLYDEFYETFNIKLTYDIFIKYLINVIHHKIGNENTIFFVYHANKIKKGFDTVKYSKIKYFTVEEIQINTGEISKNVRQMLYKFLHLYRKL